VPKTFKQKLKLLYEKKYTKTYKSVRKTYESIQISKNEFFQNFIFLKNLVTNFCNLFIYFYPVKDILNNKNIFITTSFLEIH
jgi:hypothetical protein